MSKIIGIYYIYQILENYKEVVEITNNEKSMQDLIFHSQLVLARPFTEEEQATFLADYEMALLDLKNRSTIGSENYAKYRSFDETLERIKQDLIEQELDTIYKPFEELGIKRKQEKVTIADLRKRQNEIDKEWAEKKGKGRRK